jgi:hypothetical protein
MSFLNLLLFDFKTKEVAYLIKKPTDLDGYYVK